MILKGEQEESEHDDIGNIGRIDSGGGNGSSERGKFSLSL